MMSNTTGFPSNTDPNARAYEALYSLLNDVEQRLQIVKASLASPMGAFAQGGAQPTWPHAGNSPFGFPNTGGAQQGFHALVPTQNGLVPVFIPAGQGSFIPGSSSNFRL